MSQFNTVTIFVDKINGEVAVSAKGAKFLKQGVATVQVRGKAETVRVNWFGADEALLNRGLLVQADVELSEYNDKVFTQLTIRKAVPAFSSKNEAYLTGKIQSFKEFNKVLSVEVLLTGRNRTGGTITGVQKVTVLDKSSAVAEAIKANKGNDMLLTGTLSPSKGFTDYTITSAVVLGAAAGASDAGELGVEAPAAAVPSDDLPF